MPGLFAASFSHLFAYHEFSASRFFDTTADSIVLDYTNKPATSVMVPLFSWCSVFNVYIIRFLLYSIIRSFVKFFSPRATIYFLYSLLLATFSFLAMLLKFFFLHIMHSSFYYTCNYKNDLSLYNLGFAYHFCISTYSFFYIINNCVWLGISLFDICYKYIIISINFILISLSNNVDVNILHCLS